MAEKITMEKGFEFIIKALDLTPGVEYYATLTQEDGQYICAGPVVAKDDGTALFVFDYKVTNNVKDNAVLNLLIFDKDRTSVEYRENRLIKAIGTSLNDDKNVESYQIENIN